MEIIYNTYENLRNLNSLDRCATISNRALKRRLLETRVNAAIYVIFARSTVLRGIKTFRRRTHIYTHIYRLVCSVGIVLQFLPAESRSCLKNCSSMIIVSYHETRLSVAWPRNKMPLVSFWCFRST